MAQEKSERSGCLFTIINIIRSAFPKEPEILPYRKRDDFLSPAEKSFYHVLVSALSDEAVICPKIRLGDIFFVNTRENRISHINRISSKHVDFLICEPDSMNPIAGVELDDSSHARSNREARDEFVERAFAAAELPLIRFTAKRHYYPEELVSQIRPMLNKAPDQPPPTSESGHIRIEPTEVDFTGEPICPKCGIKMVLRTAKSGQHRGKQFYGCPNFPKCRETFAYNK